MAVPDLPARRAAHHRAAGRARRHRTRKWATPQRSDWRSSTISQIKLAARRWQCRRRHADAWLPRHRRSRFLVGGCAPEEPSWEEGQIGEVYEGLSVGGAGGCSTFVVDGLSKQLIAEQNCIRANALVSFAGKKGISIGRNVYPYLEPKAATGLEAAGASSTI